MEEPTTGRVLTFLLTDVVGSTRMWEESPDAAASSLQRHERLIEVAVSKHHGRLLKSRGEGDSTFSVFSDASDAVAAAADAQADLAHEVWPEETVIRVRMALHAGETNARDDDHFGPTVNRAARLRALAGPGQVLMSHSVAQLVAGQLAPGLALVEVGPRKLRDLARPEQVFALSGPGLSTVVDDSSTAHGTTPLPARLARPEPSAFYGRSAERAIIDQALSVVENDRWRQLVMVLGEPGMGKTRLVSEAARAAHAGGATVLLGRCHAELGVPFAPFLEAFGHLARYASEEVLQNHTARHGTRLARMVPDLAERLPGRREVEAAVDLDAERYLVFVAARDLLHEASKTHPVALILDDIQWIDSISLQLLRYLIQVGEPGAVLVMATCRDTEIDPHGPLTQLLTDLWREDGTHRIVLEGFGTHEIREVVEALAGGPLGDAGEALVDALMTETGGNPFIVRQLLLHLADTGAISRRGELVQVELNLADVSVPKSVQDLVMDRVGRVGETALKTLSVAAIVESDFDAGLVASVLQLDTDEVLESLEAARASGLIRRGGQAGDFTFIHGIVSHTLSEQLGPARKQRFHARVAAELGSRPRAITSSVAHHWVASGKAGDPEQIVMWSTRAGREAMSRLAPTEAVQWFAAATNAVNSLPEAREDQAIELLIELGTAQRLGGGTGHRKTLLDAAARARAQKLDDLFIRAVLANHRGWESLGGAVDRDRVELLRAALEVESVTAGDRARLLANLASELTYDEDRNQTLGLADQALTLAKDVGDPAVLLHVLLGRFPTVFQPDRAVQCLSDTSELLDLARQVDDPQALVLAAMYRFNACLSLADLDGLDAALNLARQGVERLGLPLLQHLVLIKENMRALLAGDLPASEAFAQKAFEIGRKCGVPEAVAHYHAQVTRIRYAQGRVGELVPVFEDLVSSNPTVTPLRSTLCRLYCLLGRFDEARPLFDIDAAHEFESVPWNRYLLMNMSVYAEACADLEILPPARMLYKRLRPYCDQVPVGDATFLAPVAFYCARLATLLGEVDRAVEHFREAETINTKLESPLWSVITRSEWAATLLGRGTDADRDRAQDLIDGVIPAAAQLKFWPAIDLCTRLVTEHFPSTSP
jgi:class 3 adenylate cyclase/tetratricopeptide (TPR) repeat protein